MLPIRSITYHNEFCLLMGEQSVEKFHNIGGSCNRSEVTDVGDNKLIRIGKHCSLASFRSVFFLFYINEVRNHLDVLMNVKKVIGILTEALGDGSYGIGSVDAEGYRRLIILVVPH